MVMPNKVAEMKVTAGAGTEEGRRPTVVPAPAAASPELSERPKRRTLGLPSDWGSGPHHSTQIRLI